MAAAGAAPGPLSGNVAAMAWTAASRSRERRRPEGSEKAQGGSSSRVGEPLGGEAGQVFDRALRMMINAFEQRAAALYGDPSAGTAGSPGSSSSSAHSAA